MSRNAIAYPYRDWTYDDQAEACFPWRKIVNGCTALGLLSGLAVVFLSERLSAPAVLALVVVFIGAFIFVSVAWCKTRTATVKCARCGSDMQYRETDYPSDSVSHLHYSDIYQGGDNRVYCLMNDGDGSHWVRLMQGLRICETCKRYIIVRNQHAIHVPGNKSDVVAYEDGLRRTRKAISHLQNKKRNVDE